MDGLKQKYFMFKVDGRPCDDNGDYFVLKLNSRDEDHRNASLDAISVYADSICKKNPLLADDLRKKVCKYRPEKEG